MTRPVPRKPVPLLEVPTLDGGLWQLSEQSPTKFTMVVFYRGRHCPVCKLYLEDLTKKLGDLAARGVETIAISTDDEDRARETAAEWALDGLKIGYGISVDKAREWGLYVSSSRGKTSMGIEEPALFNEPGFFLVRPDGTLYWSIVQTMPFLRPHFAELVAVLDKIEQMDYPARGEA
ncbi:MAG: AhpC/TSA family protein [Alphaproteobacteria bacterium]|nr:AhpC/TSA family protein [Alphaproteobacteria bacterium]